MKEFKTRCERLGECQPSKPSFFLLFLAAQWFPQKLQRGLPLGSSYRQKVKKADAASLRCRGMPGATGAVSPGAVAQSTEDAAYDMLQPQDIFKMLPKDFVGPL